MRCSKVFLLLPMLISGAARADTVVLKDGDRLEGIVTERQDEVELRMDMGTVTFAKADVASIERGGTVLAELEARAARLKTEDAEGHYRLGLEAEHRGLGSFARAMFRETIASSPDHKGARAALGYRLHEGKWLTEDEFMSSQGYLKREGQWVTADAAKAMDEADAKRRAQWEDRQRRESDERRLVALERQAAEARAAEAARAQQAQDRPLYPTYLPVYGDHGWVVHPGPSTGLTLSVGKPGASLTVGVGTPPPAPVPAPAPSSAPGKPKAGGASTRSR